MSSKHAFLSPSSAYRWLLCAASPVLSQSHEEKTSPAADAGTRKHKLAEAVIRTGSLSLDEDVVAYLDYLYENSHGPLLIEQSVPISSITGEVRATGTADAINIADGTLKIFDFKTGQERVDATRNAQLMIYAAGFYVEYAYMHNIERVELHIVQPPIRNYSVWGCSIEDLEEFITTVKARGHEILEARRNGTIPAYTPGEKQCKHCKVRHVCPALREKALEDFKMIDEEEVVERSQKLPSVSVDDLSSLMERSLLIEIWMKAIKCEVFIQLSRGIQIPRWKLVTGRKGHAKFDEEALQRYVESGQIAAEDVTETVFLSPAKVRKENKKNKPLLALLEPIIYRPDGKPVIARQDDPREAITSIGEAEFEVIEDES